MDGRGVVVMKNRRREKVPIRRSKPVGATKREVSSEKPRRTEDRKTERRGTDEARGAFLERGDEQRRRRVKRRRKMRRRDR